MEWRDLSTSILEAGALKLGQALCGRYAASEAGPALARAFGCEATPAAVAAAFAAAGADRAATLAAAEADFLAAVPSMAPRQALPPMPSPPRLKRPVDGQG